MSRRTGPGDVRPAGRKLEGGGRATAARLLNLGAQAAARVEARLGDGRRLLSFLGGRLGFQPRPDDVYVVSYPRSGTTWMQLILLELTGRGDLDCAHISELSPWFERSLAIGSLTAADFERFPSPRIIKSHLPHGWLPRTGRKIYVWRDGRDVALSYFHFYRSHLGWKGDFRTFFERFLAGDLQYRSWFDHVRGWLARAGDPELLIVRYEDLQQDRAGVLQEVAAHCRLPPLDRAALPGKLAATSFEAMKAREDKLDHITAVMLERGLQPASFLRRGRSGEGQTLLDADQRHAFERRAAGPRRRLRRELRLGAFLH